MTDQTLPQTIPSDDKPAKTPRISNRIRQAIDLLVSGECKTQKAAAERVGIHRDYLCRELKKDHIRVFVDRRVRETIANGTMRASARLLELIDAGSEHVSLDAVKHLLAIEGVKPAIAPTTQVNISVKAGWVLDLREPGEIVVDVTPNRPDDDDR
jgi:hypothetical protein